MIKQFLLLEWRAFTRSASFSTNIALKIVMVFGALYFMAIFLALGFGVYFILEDAGLKPFETANKFIIYYLVFDLLIRFFLQKMPNLTIRPFLNQNIKKNTIVHYTLGKTMLSFFNSIHWFFFIPFTLVLIKQGYHPLGSILWGASLLIFVYINNFISILIDKKDAIFYTVVGIFIAIGILHYLNIFDATNYTHLFFDRCYTNRFFILIPLAIIIGFYYVTFTFFKSNLYLDAGLAIKQEDAITENYSWLDKLGSVSTFIKNDIRLIKRNKRAKTTVLMSIIFLFYGLLFFTGSVEAYDNPFMKVFAGIFVSGGFLFTFGQFVPSWDSSYYPLMMTQNITYKDYLNSKWWLIIIATVVSTIVSSFYLYFGWEAYIAIVACAIFNIGINSHLVLLGGAFIKTPIDLTSAKGAFGDKKAFNAKTMLISIPKMLLPIALYSLGHFLLSPIYGYVFIVLAGIIGFAFKNKVFQMIENIYKKEKYATLHAYKQKS